MCKKLMYLVESPFQLLGALEAIAYYKSLPYTLIVRYSNEMNARHLSNMIHYFELNNGCLKVINGSDRIRVVKYFNESIFVLWMWINARKYSIVYLADVKSRYLSFIRKLFLNKKKLVYIDDGAASLTIQNNFTVNTLFDYFTMFNMKAIPNQAIITHHFEYFQSRVNVDSFPQNNTTIILGNKFYEVGMLSKEYSEYLLRKIMDNLGDEDILYVAHRGESKEKLDEIQQEYNINVVQYDFPIELYALYKKELPKQVVALFSTALFSLLKIYPNINVTAYKMDTNKLLSHAREYEDAYAIYEDYMKVVDIS